MSDPQSKDQRISKLCKEGGHEWCMNRSPEESHCECDCHSKAPLASNPKGGLDRAWLAAMSSDPAGVLKDINEQTAEIEQLTRDYEAAIESGAEELAESQRLRAALGKADSLLREAISPILHHHDDLGDLAERIVAHVNATLAGATGETAQRQLTDAENDAMDRDLMRAIAGETAPRIAAFREMPPRPVRPGRWLGPDATEEQARQHYSMMCDYWIAEAKWQEQRANQLNAELSAFLRTRPAQETTDNFSNLPRNCA